MDKEGQLYMDDTKVVVDRLPKSFIARLKKSMVVLVWHTGPRKKRNFNVEFRTEEPLQGLWERTVKEF